MKQSSTRTALSKLCSSVLAIPLALLVTQQAKAQLSTNPDKFLGNITTSYSVDYGSEKYHTLWNQITPENESKWGSVEGSRRGSFNWGGCDNAYNYAKKYGFPFKFHCLVWGAQYPGWMDNLSEKEQLKAIEEWMDAAQKRYPDLPMIDVVNEAVAGHQPAPYRAALGGEGVTGYDWIIKAFEMAHERWPDAILIYNDYNTFQWNTDQFIDLVRTLRDAGAPIDAYGCQSHDLTDCSLSTFKASMNKLQNALKMPMYSSEYDIGTDNDALQLQRYKEQIPVMWEADYCAGITLWGYIYGKTWTTNGNSGIIRDGKDRPAMTWLREYMQTDAAKNAKSPFPGMVKEASVYVKPGSLSVTIDDVVPIEVKARLRTKTIDHVDLYVGNELLATMTEAPYKTEYVATTQGRKELKAVVVATDGTQFERWSGFTVYKPRAPFKGAIAIPGTIEGENFDSGAEGIAYHDSDSQNQGSAGSSYRSDAGGVDIERISGGYAIGWTHAGEWLEYTVDVKQAGLYEYDAYLSSQDGGGQFALALSTDDGLTDLTGNVPVLKTGNWSTYKAYHGRLRVELKEGQQRLRFIVKSGDLLFNFDKLVLRHIEVDKTMKVALSADPTPAMVNTNTTLRADVTPGKGSVKNVKFYVDNVLYRTVSAEPFEVTYHPTAKGSVNIMAVATDEEGRVSEETRLALQIVPQRGPYKNLVEMPGIIEAEDFDKGGEGLTFHDSDSKDEGNAKYRSDNEGVDIVKGNGGNAIGYTAVDEWLEYSVNFAEGGKYSYEATVASDVTGSGFTVSVVNPDGTLKTLCRVNVPKTGSSDYQTVSGTIRNHIDAGKQTLRFTIFGAQCNIDKLELKLVTSDGIEAIDNQPLTTGKVFDLSGRRIAMPSDSSVPTTLPKGVYIVNGRKVVVR